MPAAAHGVRGATQPQLRHRACRAFQKLARLPLLRLRFQDRRRCSFLAIRPPLMVQEDRLASTSMFQRLAAQKCLLLRLRRLSLALLIPLPHHVLRGQHPQDQRQQGLILYRLR